MPTKTRPRSPSRKRAESAGGEPDGGLLAAVADIARRLTDARSTELVAQDVLESVRAVTRASECAIWLDAPDALVRTWGSGTDELAEADVQAALAGGKRKDVHAREMRFGPRRVGVLAITLDRAPPDEVVRFLDTVAHQLAAFVAYSERSRRLESDLQVRMRELEEQKRFTERVVDLIPLGLYVVDREYRIAMWNRKRETGMQGVSRDDAIGRTIFEILRRQPPDLVRAEFDDVFQTGITRQFQTESLASGVARTFRLSKIPMRDDRGEVSHVITIGEDITDWIEAREAVAQSEKLAAVGRLAAGIMHEINNPLATIAACAESMALDTASPEGCPEYLKIIEAEVERCKRIVDGLLDFSRPRAQQREPLQINAVVERALFLLNHHARFKQLTVERALGADLPLVRANAEQLIQVLIALFMNAADAMPTRGRVRIRTRLAPRGGGHVVLEVQDEGMGIPHDQMARIFEPFYTTKEQGRGTGLGLAICHGIIANHGGRIEVSSEVGQGSRFIVHLPAEVACPAGTGTIPRRSGCSSLKTRSTLAPFSSTSSAGAATR